MTVDDYDNFDDVVQATHGVFGGDQAALKNGLMDHQGVSAKATPTEVVFVFQCQVCGKPTRIHVEYPEMVALKYGVNPAIAFRAHPTMVKNPTTWTYLPHAGGWNPKSNCPECSAALDIIVEPHEPERFLSAARRRNFINRAGEEHVSQICHQALAAGQGIRRP